MAAARKDEDVPPRPPAPRLSMNKGRQHSTGSISIRFKASSSLEEDWLSSDQQLPPREVTKKDPLQIELGMDATELMLSESIIKEDFSKSAPASEVTTPDFWSTTPQESVRTSNQHDNLSPTTVLCITNQLRAAQNQPPLPPPPSVEGATSSPNEKPSFISGIKERFQDPLNAFIGKIEEFSDKRGGILDTKKAKKSDLSDSRSASSSNSAQDLTNQDQYRKVGSNVETRSKEDKSHTKLSPRNSAEAPVVKNQDDDLFKTNDFPSENGVSDKHDKHRAENLSRTRLASFDMVTDFFPEPSEDFLGTPSGEHGGGQKAAFPKSCSLDALSRQTGQSPQGKESPKKIKTTLQKLIQPISGRSPSNASKSTNLPSRPVAMSFSGLLSNKDTDPEEASNSENDQFYDPQDDVAASSGSSPKPTTEAPSTLPLPPHTDPITDDSPKQAPSVLYPSRHKLLSICVAFLAYLVVPLPTYMAGMVFGAFLATVAIFAYMWWTAPPRPREDFVLPDLAMLPPLQVPEMKESNNDENEFKGWMNELTQYNPDDYHISQTCSVLVHLEGTKLRLQTPRINIPKRSMWDEPSHYTSSFIKQRHFDVVGCKVVLLPYGLIKKRLWSKKYPICLAIAGERSSPGLRHSSPETTTPDSSRRKVTKVFLFARSSRDKEDWYRRFVAASDGRPLPTQMSSIIMKNEFRSQHRRMSSSSSLENFTFVHRRQGSTDSNISDPGKDVPLHSMDSIHEQRLGDYLRYMAKVIPAESQQRIQAQAQQGRKKQGATCLLPSPANCEPQVSWVNALITRCFWDFLREKFWVKKIKEKIQKKLSKIHVPYFIDELTVTGIELGSEMPIIRRASKPYIDDRGLWIDLDIAYTGGFRMSLETKCNLMKLTNKSPADKEKVARSLRSKRSPITNSDEEDSAESSTDEEGGEENVDSPADEKSNAAQGGGASRKILRFVDKLSQSKYFQKATEYKYIKKAMEGVSNTRLLLVVELKNIAGPLAINVPPPPTDRLWYGFRKNPRLWLSAKPWVGEREVSLSHVTDWIEKKLAVEFQRVFVMPNMDDVPIPVMCDHLNDDSLDGDLP